MIHVSHNNLGRRTAYVKPSVASITLIDGDEWPGVSGTLQRNVMLGTEKRAARALAEGNQRRILILNEICGDARVKEPAR